VKFDGIVVAARFEIVATTSRRINRPGCVGKVGSLWWNIGVRSFPRAASWPVIAALLIRTTRTTATPTPPTTATRTIFSLGTFLARCACGGFIQQVQI
jgi:hypothetical protein